MNCLSGTSKPEFKDVKLANLFLKLVVIGWWLYKSTSSRVILDSEKWLLYIKHSMAKYTNWTINA